MKIISFLKNQRGFTLIELIVSMAIFVLMTALLLFRYGSFSQDIFLKNLAYDVALTVRQAQSYGLNVKSADRLGGSYLKPYGIHFDLNTSMNKKFIFFADGYPSGSPNGQYETGELLSETLIKYANKISALCSGSQASCVSVTTLDILFKRPDPNAIIYGDNSNTNNGSAVNSYAEITVQNSKGSTEKIVVRSTGQISIK